MASLYITEDQKVVVFVLYETSRKIVVHYKGKNSVYDYSDFIKARNEISFILMKNIDDKLNEFIKINSEYLKPINEKKQNDGNEQLSLF